MALERVPFGGRFAGPGRAVRAKPFVPVAGTTSVTTAWPSASEPVCAGGDRAQHDRDGAGEAGARLAAVIAHGPTA